MSDPIEPSTPPMPSDYWLTEKARQVLAETERQHKQWEREAAWDKAVKDLADMTLVVNALTAEVRDNCMKKATYSKPLKWIVGIFLTSIMIPFAAWIWAFLTRIHISPG